MVRVWEGRKNVKSSFYERDLILVLHSWCMRLGIQSVDLFTRVAPCILIPEHEYICLYHSTLHAIVGVLCLDNY